MNQKANQLARLIRAKHQKKSQKEIKPDTLIGLCLRRSPELIISMLAVLKAGGAYVPLDPDYPAERLEYMIEDSHESLIITQEEFIQNQFLSQLHQNELLVIDSEEVKALLKEEDVENLTPISGVNDLDYVIYTSGSTGKPKGVMVEHRAVCSFSVNANYIQIKESDRVAQLASMAFDAIVFEVWSSLVNGAEVILFGKNEFLNVVQLKQSIKKYKINILFLTTALFNTIIDQYPEILFPLKTVLFGCEAVNVNKVNNFLKKNSEVQLIHVYGPTEATTFSTYYLVDMKCHTYNYLPIGRATSNKFLYVLDSHLNLVPLGVVGELYIGGPGLARGYLKEETLSKERFIMNPFSKELSLPEADKIYKTGDLVRWLPDGNIEYLGRADFQVKIRGFRVELGEIENILVGHKSLSQVCVLTHGKDERKYLAAYYVVEKNQPEPRSGDLLGYLSQYLPDYMIPNAFVPLDKMPLTPSGKIDRKALPEPERHLMGEEYVAPRNEIEQELATIWCQILKLDCVGIHDDFFHLGGHSILTISLISNINQIFKLSLAVAWSFEYTTIAEQAYFILRENPSLKEYKFIIKISSPNGLIPLFLIPPAGGGAEVYLSMGKLFNTKDSLISAIYAIESYNLYHLDKPIESLKLLANKYIKYIKTIQPKGPYFLGGWSLGGTIAYEIANQLKNRGELILGVYIIDTKAIDPAVWEKIEVLKTPNNFRKNLKVLGISDAEIPQLLKLNSIEEKLLLTYTLPKSKDIAIILMQALKFETSSDKRG
ncbi:hypothetical protein CRH12_07580 [Coxiella burnetii]|nr:hypothetical protein CRH12_07580 [Coxiella burnetii]